VGIEDILTKLGGQQGQAGGLSSIMKLFGGAKGGHAGLQGLTSQLTDNGMSDQVKSWVGPGQNEPVTGSQIREAVDPEVLNQVAEQAHMTPEQASDHVAQVLPEMVNKATPQGQIPAEDPFSKGVGMLKGMFKG
jgi:uncharacterized protein YidB (DUF937 family)